MHEKRVGPFQARILVLNQLEETQERIVTERLEHSLQDITDEIRIYSLAVASVVCLILAGALSNSVLAASFQGLGDLPGGSFESTALAVSADGSVVVGSSNSASGTEAFIWDASNGMRSLKEALESDYGLDLTGWTLTYAMGISSDGLTVVGWGQNPSSDAEAWIATLDAPVPATENWGFEMGDFTAWVTQDLSTPFDPLVVRGSGWDPWGSFFTSSPTEGSFAATHGFDGNGPGTIQIARDVSLHALQTSLQFDYRAAWDLALVPALQDRTFSVTIEPVGGGTPLQTDLILTAVAGTINNDTGNLTGTVDLSAVAGQAVRISFNWWIPEDMSGPAFFQLDNVQLIPPVVPTLNTVGLAAMVVVLLSLSALFLLRRRRVQGES